MYCFTKRKLSKTDVSIPVFSLDKYQGYAKVTDVYDGDTFKACIILHNRVLKFNFRTIGYDAPEIKPLRDTPNRDKHIAMAKRAKYTFMSFLGFDDRAKHTLWNPFACKFKVNGWVWISCKRNDKYGRTLVFVYKNRRDMVSINKKMIDTGFVNAYDGGTKKEFDL
jgi:hypothetical protein